EQGQLCASLEHGYTPPPTRYRSIPSEASIVATLSRKPPGSTSLAASPTGARLAGRRSGQRIPNASTPTTRSSPQKLSHTRFTAPSETMNSTSTSNSATRALVSNDESHSSDRVVAPRPGANTISAAAPVDAPK